MNWDAVGAIAELLGAVAVFASLVYLALQIRGSTNQASAQMFQSVASEQARVSDAITGDPENLRVWMKMHHGEEMDDFEKTRMFFMVSRVVQAFLAIQIGHDKGQIDQDFYLDAKEQINEMLGSPHAKIIAKKYIERQHANQMHLEMFSKITGRSKSVNGAA